MGKLNIFNGEIKYPPEPSRSPVVAVRGVRGPLAGGCVCMRRGTNRAAGGAHDNLQHTVEVVQY